MNSIRKTFGPKLSLLYISDTLDTLREYEDSIMNERSVIRSILKQDPHLSDLEILYYGTNQDYMLNEEIEFLDSQSSKGLKYSVYY